MKTDMRRELARQRFEEKIRKVGHLIQLAAKLKGQRAANNADFVARGRRAHKNATRKFWPQNGN